MIRKFEQDRKKQRKRWKRSLPKESEQQIPLKNPKNQAVSSSQTERVVSHMQGGSS